MDYPARFIACLPFVLAQECPFPNDWSNPRNFSHDKNDRGGATMCGIIQREYDAFRKSCGEFTQPVKLITRDEGYEIYWSNYWVPHCDLFKPGCDLVFFDSAVNQGCTEAIRILQVSLGLHNDGIWGPQTRNSVGSIADHGVFIRAYTERRESVYRMTQGFGEFGKGWMGRAEKIKSIALTMTGEPHGHGI